MAVTTTARPGGLNPGHLWLADDEDKLVVSVLAPEVAGPSRHDTAGPVTLVTPDPVTRPGGMYATRPAEVGLHTPRSGGARIGWVGTACSVAVAAGGTWAAGPWTGAVVAAAGIGLTAWQALRRYTRTARRWDVGHQVLTHYDDRDVIERAAQNVRAAAVAWPRLRGHVALDDPSPVLARQLWELTMLVGERASTRRLRQDLATASVGVPATTSTALELADRIAHVDQDLVQVETVIAQRRTCLQQLAREVHAFVTEQDALARAQATIRATDQRRGRPSTQLAGNTAGDLTDHTTAVLAAYRELTHPDR
ncbi:hypothetical protein ACFFX1_10430 [Dactylosporangium sucinum]|uniref:Uncharacterized protein n=1 Tax=Dactylosporangium sucinum TaxID=1424081 RepID=A0A917WRY9_9ACTN|nr:hypothetical protein [Dactylosporangium sucinum]GGM23639.1 hypothetical protein GCM10007977_026020 [Dactylosporangium sucinum]